MIGKLPDILKHIIVNSTKQSGKESYPVRLVHVKQHLPSLVVKNFSVFQYGITN